MRALSPCSLFLPHLKFMSRQKPAGHTYLHVKPHLTSIPCWDSLYFISLGIYGLSFSGGLQTAREKQTCNLVKILRMWNKSGLVVKEREKFRVLLVSAKSYSVGLYCEDPVQTSSSALAVSFVSNSIILPHVILEK